MCLNFLSGADIGGPRHDAICANATASGGRDRAAAAICSGSDSGTLAPSPSSHLPPRSGGLGRWPPNPEFQRIEGIVENPGGGRCGGGMERYARGHSIAHRWRNQSHGQEGHIPACKLSPDCSNCVSNVTATSRSLKRSRDLQAAQLQSGNTAPRIPSRGRMT